MTLRSQIIRLAHSNPVLRPHLLELLGGPVASTPKVAVTAETVAFTDWVVLNLKGHPWSERAMQTFLENQLKQEPTPYVTVEKRGPNIEVGDLLLSKLDKTPPQNQAMAEQFKFEVGTVTDVQSDGVLLKFKNGQVGKWYGTATGASTGLYRFSEKAEYSDATTAKKLFECIYFSKPGEVEDFRKHVVKKYIEKGEEKGEDRKSCYYSGYIINFKFTKDGNVIFTLNDQQRPYPVTISPKVGQLLYLGVMQKRPNWETDFKRDVEQIVEEAADKG
jgi:hypothetical protein